MAENDKPLTWEQEFGTLEQATDPMNYKRLLTAREIGRAEGRDAALLEAAEVVCGKCGAAKSFWEPATFDGHRWGHRSADDAACWRPCDADAIHRLREGK